MRFNTEQNSLIGSITCNNSSYFFMFFFILAIWYLENENFSSERPHTNLINILLEQNIEKNRIKNGRV